jgi:hypothetical protein
VTCTEYRPDHNGECLNCDEWLDAHSLDVQLAVANRVLALYQEQAKKWNAEADKYLAQRDELQAENARLRQDVQDATRLYAALGTCDRCEKSPLDADDEPIVLCSACAEKVP